MSTQRQENKKITIITGTRAEYGLLKPIMREIQNSSMTLNIIVTGMHLSKKHGYTINEIEKDGFIVDSQVKMPIEDGTEGAMAKNLGIGILGITKAIEKINPDIIMVLGDRIEAFAGAISGMLLNKIVAHIHGGEVTKGCVDESIRHAISKLAHIHFVATKQSAKRLIKMGERPEYVYLVGAPGLDSILNMNYSSTDYLIKKYSINPNKPLFLVVQHPVTQQVKEAANQMRITLEAIEEFDSSIILIYPNNDPGGLEMIQIIESMSKPPNVSIYSNISHEDYLGLLRLASVLIGNSSSGIIEAPSFKLPVVNVGIRQSGRESTGNIINVSHDKNKIVKAIKKCLYDEVYINKLVKTKNPYGEGKASTKITKILQNLEITEELLQKQITY